MEKVEGVNREKGKGKKERIQKHLASAGHILRRENHFHAVCRFD